MSPTKYMYKRYMVFLFSPVQVDEIREYIDEIIFYIRDQFVDGRISTAKNLVMDCVIVTQNKHYIAALEKASYCKDNLKS